MFGNPEITPGGKALKFYASLRLEIRRTESIKEGDEFSGIRTRVKVVKNKVAPPFRVAEVDIMFNEGISKESGLIDVGTEFGLIKKSGAWYEYNGEKIGQGKEAAKDTLRSNKKLAAEIDKKIREAAKAKNSLPLQVGGEEVGVASEV